MRYLCNGVRLCSTLQTLCVTSLLDDIKSCTSLDRGKRIHEAVVQNGHESNVFIANSLIRMYGKCGSTSDARRVFENMQQRSLISWNVIILGYAENGESDVALDLFARMDCPPDARTFTAALKACTVNERRFGHGGEALHLLASTSGWDTDSQLRNTLVDMYAKCGDLGEARNVFEATEDHTVVSWTALMLGYVEYGKSCETLELFSRMGRGGCSPDGLTFVAALKACGDLAVNDKANEARISGNALHLLASRSAWFSDDYVKSGLVDMYAKSNNMKDAHYVFETMKHPDVVSWTTLIRGYAENGEGELALKFFSQMRRQCCLPDSKALVAALRACIDLNTKESESNNERGRSLHLLVSILGFDSNIFVEGSLVDMYAKSRNMDEAQDVFERMQYHDLVSWNSVILGYADNGRGEDALCMFERARREGCGPDAITYIAALKACSDVGRCKESRKMIHLLASCTGCDSNIYLNNTLVDTYAKCGSMEDAREVFEGMAYHTEVSWAALLLGYAENGESKLVLELFARMRLEKCGLVALTFVTALKACSNLGALDFGKALHEEILSRDLQNDLIVANCLVDFYARCGSLVEAKEVFESHGTKNLITWSSLMAGYSRHGDTESVFRLFERLLTTGLQPNCVIFLCVLTACSHAGLVEKGKDYFESMYTKYGLNPEVEHYTCMLDMLGRTNKLEEGMALLRSMLYTPDEVTWMTIMGACRKWKNVGLGRLAFESSLSLNDRDAGAYVLMANIYGSKGMWKEQAEVQAMRMKLKAWKKPGQSWWTNKVGAVHTFSVGDTSHPQIQEIQAKLVDVVRKMRDCGYVADLSSVTRNLSDTAKEDALCGHSEKLAIACALINTSHRETIRIIKNLRVCDDCHTACGLISKIEERTILCRDTSRFHVFKDGICSCGDFW